MRARVVPLRFVVALLLAAVALAGCIVVPLSSHAFLKASLTADQEVPPVMATGNGTLEASYNKLTKVLSYKLTYAGLSGVPTAAHFHGPARAGVNAGVVLPIASSGQNPLKGEATLTEQQATELQAGLWYVNIHTAVNPGGEIRGQVTTR